MEEITRKKVDSTIKTTSLVSIFIGGSSLIMGVVFSINNLDHDKYVFLISLCLAGFFPSLISIITLFAIDTKETKKGILPSIGLLICLFSFFYVSNLAKFAPRYIMKIGVCKSRLSSVYKFLDNYKQETGRYPDPNKWCNLLIKETDCSEKSLKCPADKVGPCSYAMNPNCEPNSPGDMVLLFESKPGWNKYGGPELLYPENHDGCNVLFNDGHVVFVIQKDAEKLKWK